MALGQWLTAVTSMKGESDTMTLPSAVEMIRALRPASGLSLLPKSGTVVQGAVVFRVGCAKVNSFSAFAVAQ